MTVGDHALLLPFMVERIARAAEEVWAHGVARVGPPSLAPFSFAAFVKARSPENLCRELEAALNQRMGEHASPAAAFTLAMKELKAAGHDLWCWTPEEVWGCDYQKKRSRAALHVTRDTPDDEAGGESTAVVEFSPPR